MNSNSDELVRQLAELLQESQVLPRFNSQRIVSSAIYDPAYRACIIALTLRECGKRTSYGHYLSEQLARLYQFVAVHGTLLNPLQEWVAARKSGVLVPLFKWTGFPSGYVIDSAYDQLLDYLLATGQLRREGTGLALPQTRERNFLSTLLDRIGATNLFERERFTLAELRTQRITLSMLQP